jgi:hypothetical protein
VTLKSLINEGNYKQYGLESFDDVQKLQLGDPLPLFYVRADQLKDYKPGSDAGKLMISTNREIYPVVLNGTGKLLMTVAKTGDSWRAVSFGEQDVAPSFTKIKADKPKKVATGPGTAERNYFVVQVPAMHLMFLAFSPPPGPGGGPDDKRQVTLTPLTSKQGLQKSVGFSDSNFLAKNPNFNPQNEGSKSANDVFKTLGPNATKAMADVPR